jgi:hypothetical protein
MLKNGTPGRDPALRGYWNCSHIGEYAARSKTSRALADGLMLVFSTLLNGNRAGPSRVISDSRRGIDLWKAS